MAFVEINGHRIEYADIPAARRGAAVLVLLHEGLGSLAMWRDFPKKLARATACRTVTYSRWGYGRSDRFPGPRDPRYMHREALDELPALRAALAIDDPVLVGHSDGASIALIHAGAGRWPVRGMILEAPHVFVEDVSIAGIEEAKHAYEDEGFKRRLARYHADVEGAFRGWNDVWLSPEFRAWNVEDCLPGVVCPILAIQGLDDQYGTVAQINAIGRQVKGPFEKLILEDCMHAPHRDQEDDALAAMAGFVDELESARRTARR
ncbi:MAG: alpha/beta hydrolase [Alphaproteobacteria bacterium]|nr:alpha/beta hydrolase [Alphaproteobacteria bacterium]